MRRNTYCVTFKTAQGTHLKFYCPHISREVSTGYTDYKIVDENEAQDYHIHQDWYYNRNTAVTLCLSKNVYQLNKLMMMASYMPNSIP